MAREVDVVDGYSTDGAIAGYDLVVLEDDRDFFPPYDAAPLGSSRLARSSPRALLALARLPGHIPVERMRTWNDRVEVGREPAGTVAREALAELGVLAGAAASGEETTRAGPDLASPPRDGLLRYLVAWQGLLLRLTGQHLLLAAGSLMAAILLAVPIGLALERWRGSTEAVIRAMGLLQTVPSIALLAFMIPLLSIGLVPTLTSLFLYSRFPILRNTFTGVRDADPVAVDAVRSLGMTARQILWHVCLPLVAPVIMAGIRTTAVINIGIATLAAFIGAGGLGDPIVSGLALSDTQMILSGAIPAAALAVVVDAGLGLLEQAVTTDGVAIWR